MQVHFFRPTCFTDFSKMISTSWFRRDEGFEKHLPLAGWEMLLSPRYWRQDQVEKATTEPIPCCHQSEWEVGLDMSPGSSLILLVWKLPISSLVPFCMQHFREDDPRCFTFRWLYGSTINRELTGRQPDNVLFINAARLPDWIINRVL